ncbi:hypothetical protein ACTHSL_09480 [Neisseria sp. P0008.S010]|uniref:hypothetical protein n=1 Tax=Neisseria sp. P0008.S010 TaxID=3436707 RepID=UPI003F7EC556
MGIHIFIHILLLHFPGGLPAQIVALGGSQPGEKPFQVIGHAFGGKRSQRQGGQEDEQGFFHDVFSLSMQRFIGIFHWFCHIFRNAVKKKAKGIAGMPAFQTAFTACAAVSR